MDAEFWLQRWREGRIGWHHDAVMPLLEKHWPALEVTHGAAVLVPLCGKSLDMLWLSQQGLHVLGIELSGIAIAAFLMENDLHARTRTTAFAGRTQYRISNSPDGGHIDIINGDVFEVDPARIAACDAFYDRAAMIALPAALRERLVRDVYAELGADARGLLITLDYPTGEMEGPPFSVDAAEVHRLFDGAWQFEQLERRDILASQPSFTQKGVTALHTTVYALARKPA